MSMSTLTAQFRQRQTIVRNKTIYKMRNTFFISNITQASGMEFHSISFTPKNISGAAANEPIAEMIGSALGVAGKHHLPCFHAYK